MCRPVRFHPDSSKLSAVSEGLKTQSRASQKNRNHMLLLQYLAFMQQLHAVAPPSCCFKESQFALIVLVLFASALMEHRYYAAEPGRVRWTETPPSSF